jgi:hypothetical protein
MPRLPATVDCHFLNLNVDCRSLNLEIDIIIGSVDGAVKESAVEGVNTGPVG